MDLDLDTHVRTSQLINIVEHLAKDMDSQKQIDMIFLDFSKAFDTVLHQCLLTKLQYYGINNKIYHWISNWLTKRSQRVLVNRNSSMSLLSLECPRAQCWVPLCFSCI